MALDLSKLNNATGLVQTSDISSESERTVMRTAGDLKILNQLLIDSEISCNDSKRKNVMQNVFGFKAQRKRYDT
jgi:hypothetical protein|tara:strand:+ start:534 stop:755 length:222 start_codon:yes stop_codon:yes gene_type:complete